MALVVHVAFPLNGRDYKPGDVVFGADADDVAARPALARRCTAVADESIFEHLRPVEPVAVAAPAAAARAAKAAPIEAAAAPDAPKA